MLKIKIQHVFLLFAALLLSQEAAAAQTVPAQPALGQPNTGVLISSPRSPAGRVLPDTIDPRFIASLYGLRDAVYDYTLPSDVERMAAALLQAVPLQPFDDLDRNLVISRIEYLTAKSLNDSGDKKKAIPHFEAAIEAGKRSMAAGEHPAGLMAVTKPLSELCIIKDVGYLIANGPKIAQNANKVLAMKPGHIGATLALAASKAYPPPVFGGNAQEAVDKATALILNHRDGFEKDELFDIRVCIGTAIAKLDRKEEARLWFTAALELYPHNAYPKAELEKLKP
jgi:hypothetical protein